jgi:hypothetical protein
MNKAPYAPNWVKAQEAARAAPRCGARTRRCTPCAGPAMTNGRCRMHGGASTGARTATGLERLRQAPLKHGRRGAEARQAARERGAARRELATLDALLRELDELTQHRVCP